QLLQRRIVELHVADDRTSGRVAHGVDGHVYPVHADAAEGTGALVRLPALPGGSQVPAVGQHGIETQVPRIGAEHAAVVRAHALIDVAEEGPELVQLEGIDSRVIHRLRDVRRQEGVLAVDGRVPAVLQRVPAAHVRVVGFGTADQNLREGAHGIREAVLRGGEQGPTHYFVARG